MALFTAGSSIAVADLNSIIRFADRTSDSSARASTTTVADDDQIQIPVDANARYAIHGWLAWSCTSTTPGFKYTFSIPSGSISRRSFYSHASSSTSTTDTIQTGANTGTTEQSSNTVNGTNTGLILGRVNIGATPGNMILQWAQNTSNAAGVTLLNGSFVYLVRLA